MFGSGSPVRYWLPAAPITVAATLASVVRGWRREADRPALAVAGACTVAGAALTGHLVRSVNRRLLGPDPMDPAERRRLIRHWHRVNGVRLVLAGSALAALERCDRARETRRPRTPVGVLAQARPWATPTPGVRRRTRLTRWPEAG